MKQPEPVGKQKKITCPECDGAGKDEAENICPECDGKGTLEAVIVKQ